MKKTINTYEKQSDGSMKLIETQQIEVEEPLPVKIDLLVTLLVQKGLITVADEEELGK